MQSETINSQFGLLLSHLNISQYLNSTFENVLFTSQLFGLSGIAAERLHISLLLISSKGVESLFLRFQGFECGFEKSIGDGMTEEGWASHILGPSFSGDEADAGGDHVLDLFTGFTSDSEEIALSQWVSDSVLGVGSKTSYELSRGSLLWRGGVAFSSY
jgi:hypothetical protein